MTLNAILNYLTFWSIIGAILFNLIVIYLFRSGIVFESRGQDGLRKRDSSVKGWVSTFGFLALVVIFLVTGNYIGIILNNPNISFWQLFWLNFGLMMILVIYDSIVIDWLVIVLWRPAFLKLPDAINAESMKKHILITIPVAPVICLVIAGISAGLTIFIW